jgi:hypothetical protein
MKICILFAKIGLETPCRYLDTMIERSSEHEQQVFLFSTCNQAYHSDLIVQ